MRIHSSVADHQTVVVGLGERQYERLDGFVRPVTAEPLASSSETDCTAMKRH